MVQNITCFLLYSATCKPERQYVVSLVLLSKMSFFLAKMGILQATFMKKYRRHALVLIGIVAAVITPPDLFTCFMVMMPMYGLYELSILIVERIKTI